jgi:hypothetical protein
MPPSLNLPSGPMGSVRLVRENSPVGSMTVDQLGLDKSGLNVWEYLESGEMSTVY